MTTKITIAALAAIVLGFGLFWIVTQSTRRDKTDFRDVVRDPSLWNQMIEAETKKHETETANASKWTAQEIDEKVRQFVFTKGNEEDVRPLGNTLESLSPSTYEALLNILRDPSNHSELATLRKEGFRERAPVMRICDLFAGRMPDEAIVLLKPFLEHESSDIRKECILAVAESGKGSALPFVSNALKDKDQFVRSYALIGLRRALDSKKLSPVIATDLLPELENSILADQEVEECSQLLSLLEPARAKAFLTSDIVLTPNRRTVHEVIRSVRKFKIEVPRERVLALYHELSKREMKYPNNYAVGELLALLGSMRNPLDKGLLEEMCRYPESEVSEGAAQGLLSYHGLGDFRKKIWDIEASDPSSLTKEQQLYIAVSMLDAEINNGGHSQYFFNSFGDDWKNALDGLKSMGLHDRAAIFQKSLDYFGPQGPSTDRDTRQKQLSKIYRKHEAEFNKLDSQYYDTKENVEVASIQFVIRNADQFQ